MNREDLKLTPEELENINPSIEEIKQAVDKYYGGKSTIENREAAMTIVYQQKLPKPNLIKSSRVIG